MAQYIRDPLGFYTKAARSYGGVVRVRAFPGFYWVMVSDPEAVEHVLHANQENYRKPAVFTRLMGRLAGLGILTSDGETWLRNRRLMQPAFHRQRIAAMVGVMADGVRQSADRLAEASRAGRPVDVLSEMTRMSLGIASRTLFGTDVSGESDEIGSAFREAITYVSGLMHSPLPLPDWVPTPRNRRFHRAKAKLDDLVHGLIRERRRTGGDAGDLLSMLLLARDEETGEVMTDRQVRDEVLTLLFAGHETTAAALAWAWYLLARNPDAADRLRAEADGVLGDRPPAFDDLPCLAYARLVFEESLRLYPVAWGQPRQSIGDDEIGGYFVRRGTLVGPSQWVTHRRPDLWDDPERFDPERFAPGRSGGRHRFAYYPFGGGGRVCLGAALATAEAQIALACLGRRFTFALVPGHQVVPDPTFVLRPKQALMMTVNER
jgi:cytochrome P450